MIHSTLDETQLRRVVCADPPEPWLTNEYSTGIECLPSCRNFLGITGGSDTHQVPASNGEKTKPFTFAFDTPSGFTHIFLLIGNVHGSDNRQWPGCVVRTWAQWGPGSTGSSEILTDILRENTLLKGDQDLTLTWGISYSMLFGIWFHC